MAGIPLGYLLINFVWFVPFYHYKCNDVANIIFFIYCNIVALDFFSDASQALLIHKNQFEIARETI